jgi:superfamily II DNA or RNA helicase
VDVKVHHLINATGGREALDTIQKLGRGLRRAPDKKRLDYHDFYFKTNHYLRSHSAKRMNALKKEGHTVVIEDEIDID